jgi:hypothetical protein
MDKTVNVLVVQNVLNISKMQEASTNVLHILDILWVSNKGKVVPVLKYHVMKTYGEMELALGGY